MKNYAVRVRYQPENIIDNDDSVFEIRRTALGFGSNPLNISGNIQHIRKKHLL
jgi:hypothetical protein